MFMSDLNLNQWNMWALALHAKGNKEKLPDN